MLSILISKKPFGATLFLRREIQIFMEQAVSILSCQIEGFSLTKYWFPYTIPVFSPFPLSIHLIINKQSNHITRLKKIGSFRRYLSFASSPRICLYSLRSVQLNIPQIFQFNHASFGKFRGIQEETLMNRRVPR